MAMRKKNNNSLKKNKVSKLEASNTKTKSENAKQTIRKKINEFGDNDAL